MILENKVMTMNAAKEPVGFPRLCLTHFPFEVLHMIVAHLDIRSSARFTRCCAYLSGSSSSGSNPSSNPADNVLLTNHPHWPLLSSVVANDLPAFRSALSKLCSILDKVPEAQPDRETIRAGIDALEEWEPRRTLSILVKSCFCVLLTARNDNHPSWWVALENVIETYQINLVAVAQRLWAGKSVRQYMLECQNQPPWLDRNRRAPRDSVIEAAVNKAFARCHFDSFRAFAAVCKRTKFIESCLHLGPLIRTLFGVPLSRDHNLFPVTLSRLPVAMREEMLLLVFQLADEDSQFPDELDTVGGGTHLCRMIIGSNHDIGTIIRLTVALSHTRLMREPGAVFLALLDACGYHHRPDVVDTLMRLYLVGSKQFPIKYRRTRAHDGRLRPLDRYHRPEIIIPEWTVELLRREWVQKLSRFGVTEGQVNAFLRVSAACELSVFLLPWLVRGITSPCSVNSQLSQHPWLALDWLLRHMELNIYLIHTVPFMLRAEQDECAFRAPDSCLGSLLRFVPFDFQSFGHVSEHEKDFYDAKVFPNVPGMYVTSHASNCYRCRDLVAAAAIKDESLASPAQRLLARVFSHRGQWRIWYNDRPEAEVHQDLELVCQFMASVKSQSRPAASPSYMQLPPDWLHYFVDQDQFQWDGPAIFHAWKAAALQQHHANRIPLSHAVDALLIRALVTEATQVLIAAAEEAHQSSDLNEWVLTEDRLANLRALFNTQPSNVSQLLQVAVQHGRVPVEIKESETFVSLMAAL